MYSICLYYCCVITSAVLSFSYLPYSVSVFEKLLIYVSDLMFHFFQIERLHVTCFKFYQNGFAAPLYI